MKRTKTLGITLIGLAVGLLSGCASSAQYGQSRSPYPPSQDQRQRDYDQPGYDQYGYDEPYDGDFYDDLRPHGQWVRTPEYGMVWIPNVDAGFQPYATNGRWVVTQFGNTWVSDYNWGWAPFHYGRWYQDRFRGWAWVPGRDWGPAWVSWRSGGGYYGWAPLGPGANFNMNIAPDYWVFVPQNYISSPRLFSYCVPRRQVVNVYQNTTIINNVYRANNRSYAYGPRRDELERVTRQRVPVYRIDNTNRPGRDEVRDNSVSIYRPERSRGPRGSYEQPSSGNYNDRRGTYGRPNENTSTGSGRSSESRGGYSQPDNRGGYQRPSNDGGNSGRPTEPGTYQRPNSRGNGTYSGSDSRPAPAPYEGNGPRGRYNDNTQRAPQSGPQPAPQAQPEQRMESLPQPGYGGRRGSGGGGGYSQPQPQREPSQSNGNGPGYSQPNNRGSREAQPQPQPQSQPQPQEQRPGNYERRAQEADRNLGQPPAQSQPGNGGRSRGPR